MQEMQRRWPNLTCAAILFVGLLTTAGLSLYADSPYEQAVAEPAATEVCSGEKLGTTINWYQDKAEAARLAREQGKLLFVMQISGNFADEEFT